MKTREMADDHVFLWWHSLSSLSNFYQTKNDLSLSFLNYFSEIIKSSNRFVRLQMTHFSLILNWDALLLADQYMSFFLMQKRWRHSKSMLLRLVRKRSMCFYSNNNNDAYEWRFDLKMMFSLSPEVKATSLSVVPLTIGLSCKPN